MAVENAPRCLSRSGAELQDVPARRRGGDGLLELLVARNLLEHFVEIRLGIPLEVAHCADHSPR